MTCCTSTSTRAKKRACAWCGADISGRGLKARFCDNKNKCAARFYYQRDRMKIRARANKRKRDKTGCPPLEKRHCAHCGNQFDAFHARQIYCSDRCRERAQYYRSMRDAPEKIRAANARWRKDNSEKRARLARDRRAADPEHHRQLRAKWYARNLEKVRARGRERYWHNPERFRADQNERDRRHQAERALSLLLLPTQNPPEM